MAPHVYAVVWAVARRGGGGGGAPPKPRWDSAPGGAADDDSIKPAGFVRHELPNLSLNPVWLGGLRDKFGDEVAKPNRWLD